MNWATRRDTGVRRLRVATGELWAATNRVEERDSGVRLAGLARFR